VLTQHHESQAGSIVFREETQRKLQLDPAIHKFKITAQFADFLTVKTGGSQ